MINVYIYFYVDNVWIEYRVEKWKGGQSLNCAE